MHKFILVAVATFVASGSQAHAQTKPVQAAQPATAGICAKLMADYEHVSQNMADNLASSVTDNSAPRATLRAMEDSNDLAKARLALDIMRDNRCTLPKYVPNPARYALAALKCKTARYSAKINETPAECKRELWKPEIE
ncbi:hypothetical protein J2W22_002866 [Sphingomonas kyeonggiensis]|uniref:hypothetical protein n=1 Tax=Sphingomonas kyeonggiensis TaxID=1268553 RepID=UPI00277F80B0|nr:hypothetical protein [Sphingomonas kyeonggiensis]MDQ0250802.1 hypothetical protein [Sphingomonas kyeonggiensis]